MSIHSSSAIIALPRQVFMKRRAKRIMPFVFVSCPADHILRMPAESIAAGRDCFCPHCRARFKPRPETAERARYQLEVGTRARSPMPPILAGANSSRHALLPAGLRILLRRTWRRVRRWLKEPT